MGKKLADLNLDDSGPGKQDDLGIQERLVEKWIAKLQAMADDSRYGFCWGMLTDMRLTLQQTRRISQGQMDAVHNIEVGAQRHDDHRQEGKGRGGKRRYEGWVG